MFKFSSVFQVGFVAVVFYIRGLVYAEIRAVCSIYFAFIFHTCMSKHRGFLLSNARDRCTGCFCFHVIMLVGINVHTGYVVEYVCGKYVQQLPRD